MMESFQFTFGDITDKSHGSSFSHLYKNRPSKQESQGSRRQKLLEQQKKKRHSLQDESRLLLLAECDEELHDNKSTQNKKISSTKTTQNLFGDQLMLSEWMEELPDELENEWLLIPCPVGMRVLIVANRGKTKAFTKRGRCLWEFQSALPGGCTNSIQTYKNSSTVLDCIYSEATEIFYILDVLAWGNQSFTNCEAEFRFFWLNGKISENKDLMQKNIKINSYPFVLLPRFICSKESISNALSNWPFFTNNVPCVDGLLFYHKNALYTSGSTPTVLWLLPFMVPEVICSSIMINNNYMSDKPIDYQNQELFIAKFNEEQKNKKKKKHFKTQTKLMDMEVQDTSSTFGINMEVNTANNKMDV